MPSRFTASSCSNWAWMVAISAEACVRDTPSFSRPITSRPCRVSRPSRAASIARAIHRSCVTGNANVGAITPTMVVAVPLTRRVLPSTSARCSNRSRHSRSLMIATGSAPIRPEAASKSRPSTGRVRSRPNVFGVIHAAR